jgi:transposase
MRGRPTEQTSMLCLVSLESRIAADHPLRGIKKLADAALRRLSERFDAMYAKCGRPSIPPERLLKALLLIALHSVRSERQFCEQLEYNLLFRWFLDMDLMEPAFDASTFSRNRQRMLDSAIAAQFFQAVRDQGAELMSREHFSVDGTLIESWASIKSFRPKDDDPGQGDSNGWGDFRGHKRSNQTHQSKTDPEARLMRKGRGREAKLSFGGHALVENRHGLLVDLRVSEATGRSERQTAIEMLEQRQRRRRITVGADRGYDSTDFVGHCRDAKITAHVAQNTHCRSAIDGRTVRHAGYAISQRVRRRIEQVFGWIKTVGGLRRSRYRGRQRTQFAAHLVGAAYNLLRIAKLVAHSP